MADDPNRPHLHVEFFSQPMEDPAASREAGRKIFREQTMVRIRWPGDRKRELIALAADRYLMDQRTGYHLTYAEAFPEQFRAFGAQQSQEVGTPLALLPFISAVKAAELKAANVHTAEALAQLSDRDITKLGFGTRDLVDQTREWLEQAAGAAVNAGLREQNADLLARLERMEAMLRTPQAVFEDSDPVGWDEDRLRAWLSEHGVVAKKTAKHEELIDAVRTMQGSVAA